MAEYDDRDWLGWTEADFVQLSLKIGWANNPWSQALEDALEFFSVVVYCTHPRHR